MKIIVAGLGFVGASTAVLLAKNNQVLALDPDSNKIQAVLQGRSPLNDPDMETLFDNKEISIGSCSTDNPFTDDVDYLVIAVPTDWSHDTDSIDTHHIENLVHQLEKSDCPAAVVIRSTVPIGFTDTLAKKYPHRSFVYCPEFLQEGTAMYDELHPQRIILGRPTLNDSAVSSASIFAELMINGIKALDPSDYEYPQVLFMETSEAEAVKLFSNAYLASRISFFNELDGFAETHGLNSESIIRGVCADDRIGDYYNNPSFGFGGYCLPKDSRQLLNDTLSKPGSLIHSIIESNNNRKIAIVENLLAAASAHPDFREQQTIGIYRLTNKHASDGIRSAAILDIVNLLAAHDLSLVIYEPLIHDQSELSKWLPKDSCSKISLASDLDSFKKSCPFIVANRWEDELEDVREKVYTRDIFYRN